MAKKKSKKGDRSLQKRLKEVKKNNEEELDQESLEDLDFVIEVLEERLEKDNNRQFKR